MSLLQQTQISPRKFARAQRRGETLDRINDHLYMDSPDGRSKHLHPTKGFRTTSDKRLMASGGKREMVSVFWATISRAQKHAQKSV